MQYLDNKVFDIIDARCNREVEAQTYLAFSNKFKQLFRLFHFKGTLFALPPQRAHGVTY